MFLRLGPRAPARGLQPPAGLPAWAMLRKPGGRGAPEEGRGRGEPTRVPGRIGDWSRLRAGLDHR